jgi:phospholipid/cholesterol/gamma-HCH transport system substrate-binding protein
MNKLLGALFALLLISPPAVAVLAARGVFGGAREATLLLEEATRRPSPGADVTLHGLVIGRVEAVTAVGHGASVGLRLDQRPAVAVAARLLPRTLIGDVYVELVPVPGPRNRVIRQDRSRESVELQRVIDSALPLLRAVDPAKVATILTAIGTALSGRGMGIGESIDRLARILPRASAELPALRSAVRNLVLAADAAADVVPQALAALRDLPGVGLKEFVASATTATAAATEVLAGNESRLVELAEAARPTLELLARYSPEFGCLAKGLADSRGRLDTAFGGGLRVTFEVAAPRSAYRAGRDAPRNVRTGTPSCAGLPAPSQGGGGGGSADMGYAGTPQEDAVLRPVLAAAMTRPVDGVPDVATLLVGPLARGTVVEVG